MSTREVAEQAIADAISVLEWVEHGELETNRLAAAVKLFREGQFEAAATTAFRITKGPMSLGSAAPISKLKQLFNEARRATQPDKMISPVLPITPISRLG